MKDNPARTMSQACALALTAFVMMQSGRAAPEPAAATSEKPAATATEKAAVQPPPEKKGWETTAAAGLTLTRGNSDTLLVTMSLDTQRKWEKSEIGLGLSGGYGEDRSVRSMEYVRGHGDYREMITPRFYTGLHVDGAYDGIANLDYRVVISPMAGYYLVQNDMTSLRFEGGPALVLERYSHQPQSGYWGVRLGERLDQKIGNRAKFWQSLDYVARVDRWSDKYQVTGELGIDTTIIKQWSLRLVFQDVYESIPAIGKKHNDMRLIGGIAYSF
ncbi:MAG: DUF481 domain-containing protein [Candidatus Omnitrophica bacterium]|nr:DUF481 domain-containing protein [Candidatus Omnitrophota bacterium]